MAPWTGPERRRRPRRETDTDARIARTRRGPWGDLHAPIRVLIFLLILLVLIQVYNQAQFLVTRVFSVLLLFVFAAIVAMLLTPLVDRVQDLGPFGGRRGLAVLAVNLVLIALLGLLLAALIPSVVAQSSAFGDEFPKLLRQAQDHLDTFQAELARRGLPLHLTSVPTGLEGLVAPALGSAVQIVGGTLNTLVNLILIAVIAIYLQMQGRQIIAALRQLFPDQQELFDFSLVAAGSTLAGYIRGQVIFAGVMAVYTGLTLSIIGVHFALVIAVITFFLELVPLIGAPIAMLLAIGIAVLQGPVVILVVAITTLIGHIIGAYTIGLRVMGKATRLHALVAMGALLVGAELGGVLGALFAIPIAGLINVYLGALFRVRRGEAAFSLPTGSQEAGMSGLPNLGEEISQMAEEAR